MAVVSLQELIDVIIITLALGYIFKDVFKVPITSTHPDDIIAQYKKKIAGINAHDFWNAALITAPAVVLHEVGHKVVAMLFGAHAVFHAHYTFLGIGVVLKLLNFGFIFFVPGFVSYSGIGLQAWHSMLIAFSGPFMNLLLWQGTKWYVAYNPKLSDKWRKILVLTGKINMFLFFFNMIPIPPFDGYKVFSGLISFFM